MIIFKDLIQKVVGEYFFHQNLYSINQRKGYKEAVATSRPIDGRARTEFRLALVMMMKMSR